MNQPTNQSTNKIDHTVRLVEIRCVTLTFDPMTLKT